MLIYNGQIIAGGGTIVLPMTRAEYEANKAILDSADVWVDLTDEPDQVATADQIAYSVGGVQKGMGYIGDIATKAVAKVEPTDTALYLHEVGEYFINKDGDACKVDLQIPVNGTITLGTNCHVLSKGVANDINSNLSNKINYAGNFSDINMAKNWFISNVPTKCSMGTHGSGGANTLIFSVNDSGYGNILEILWNDTAQIHFCNNGTWTTKTIQLS